MEGRARILIYGFSADEGARIDAALAAKGVPATTRLRAAQGDVVLSDIIAHDREGAGGPASSEPVVLFFNVSEAGIRTLIPYIRSLEIPRPIFAMVTETSYRWTLAQLLEHLAEEKRAVEQRAAEGRAEASGEAGDQSGSKGS